MSNIGIEVEIESEMLTRFTAADLLAGSHWAVEEDGSLRGGGRAFELKFRQAYPHSRVHRILAELYPVLVGSSGSWRAAVHVHVDARDMTNVVRGMFLGLATIFDKALFERHSPERIESNFSVPLMHKASAVESALYAMLHHGALEHYGKYSSINVRTLDTFGSVEFRHMRTPGCTGEVLSVKSALDAIQSYVDDCFKLRVHAMSAVYSMATRSTRTKLDRRDYRQACAAMTSAVEGVTNDTTLRPDGNALAMVLNVIDKSAGSYVPTCIDAVSLQMAGAARRPRSVRTSTTRTARESLMDIINAADPSLTEEWFEDGGDGLSILDDIAEELNQVEPITDRR